MNNEDEFDIRQYLSVLRRRAWVIAAVTIVCALVALAVSLSQDKVYTATAKVVVSAQQDVTSSSSGALSDPNQLQTQIQTEVQIVESPQVETLANQSIGTESSQVQSVKASGVTNTRVMSITATSKNPAVAQKAANAYSDAYLTVGSQQETQRLLSIGQTVQAQITSLQSQVSTIQGQKPINNSAINSLNNQISQLQSQYDATQAAALVREASAQPLSSAELPTSPTSPQPLRNTAVGFVLGLLLGIGLALLWERLDDRLRSGAQLNQWFPTLTLIGSIPRARGWKKRDEARNITLLEPQSELAEAYRGVRTSIEFLALDTDLRVIEITSARAGEGKSTTVANLATALAWGGKKVVIVSADLRRPRVHDFFGLSNETGITSVLLEGRPAAEALQHANIGSQEGSVSVLTTGPLPPNPSELLASKSVADIFATLRQAADYVLIDSPPVLPVADSLVLSKYADGIVLVAGVGEVHKGEIAKTVETLNKSIHAPLIGVLINGSNEELTYSSKYGSYSSYAAAPVTPAPRHAAPVEPVTDIIDIDEAVISIMESDEEPAPKPKAKRTRKATAKKTTAAAAGTVKEAEPTTATETTD